METIKKTYQPAPNCPVDYAFQRVGGKYKGRILSMLKNGTMRFGQLRKAIAGVSPKMLTQVLRELEDDQLIMRTVYYEVPPRVEYGITDNAQRLMPSIELMAVWGREQMELNQMATGH
jgi:DNA-binding HxlR family transcriptional regulator